MTVTFSIKLPPPSIAIDLELNSFFVRQGGGIGARQWFILVVNMINYQQHG
jgi:hypothetical protein